MSMKKTTINVTNKQWEDLSKRSKELNKDRSTVIRELLDNGLRGPPSMCGSNGVISRLTESARFVPAASDVVAYSYAGALHYLEQEKMIALATQLYSQNPLAHRIIEVITDFCVGDSITWETDDENLRDVLDEFWDHPRNELDNSQYQRVSELLLYGEQCYPVFVNPMSGLVQLGSVHPAFIKQTVLDPDHYNFVIGVEVNNSAVSTTTYRTIFLDDERTFLNDKALEMREEMTGDCFYFAINRLSLPMVANGYGERSYQNRGRSELLPLIDRLGMLDDLNYLNLDRIQILLSVIYDITVNQGTPKDIQRVTDEFGLPSGPAVRVHDEKMSIDVKTPNLGASETSTLFKTLQDEILGGVGLPSHWVGEGQANRASAMSMELPTLKKLKAKQRIVAGMFRKIIDYQVLEASNAGRVDTDATYSLNVPAITRKDLITIGDALNKGVGNLEKAVQSRWITNRAAGEVFREIASGYGIELKEPEDVGDIDEMMKVSRIVGEEEQEASHGEPAVHDYTGVDNPEEPREEKDERDLAKAVSEA